MDEIQDLYEAVVKLRGDRWSQQGQVERSHDLDVDELGDSEPTPRETWWFHQGAAEALAAVMTALEARGARVVTL